ncbi:MAG: ribosome maturation factor RimM [Eubacteriales bacterium]
MNRQPYLECAKIVGTHGVRGTVRLENRCDSPAALASLPRMYYREPKTGEWRTLNVLHSSVQKNMVLTSFDGISTLEDAILWRDTVLYADRRDIPLATGAHFIADLIGLPVVDAESGEQAGVLEEVISPAGQDIYVVRKPAGGTFMIPAVPAFVKAVSLGEEDGRAAGIYVRLIEGMTE